MSRKIQIDLLTHQKEFLESKAHQTAIVAGLGSGKSFAGALKTCIKLIENKGAVAYYLPTVPLIRQVGHVIFEDALNLLKIEYNLNKTFNDIVTEHGTIHLRSLEVPKSIIGYSISYACVDEIDSLPVDKAKQCVTKIYGRIRLPDAKGINQLDFVGSPEGFFYLHKNFVKEKTDDKRLIHAVTWDNTFLDEQYARKMLSVYTESELQAYRDGKFINLRSGSVYTGFDREKNRTSREIRNTDDTLLIGLDFNYGNCSFVAGIYEDKKLQILDEGIGILNTYQMVEVLKARYPGKRLIIHPDSSGANNSTSSTWSDIDILKNHFKVAYLRSNPAVMERVNRVNLFFEKVQLVINVNKCKELVTCLENQTFKNGMPDKTVNLDHLPDGLGYMVWQFEIEYYENPYNSPGSILIGPNYSSWSGNDDDYDDDDEDYDYESGWGGTVLTNDSKYKTGWAPDGTRYLRDY